MKRFLSQISLPDAITILTTSFNAPQRTEKIPVEHSAGRIAASPVYAPETIPSSRIATMDGIAVLSADTVSARDQEPVTITDALIINTGQGVPDRYDAVIPAEEIGFLPEDRFQIRRPATHSQNIRNPGEEVREGQLILRPGEQIIPSDIGALLTYGIRTVEVRALVVGLIPTGDELVSFDTEPGLGKVRESNTTMLAAALIQMGVTPVRFPIVRDDQGMIREAIRVAHQSSDVVIISAGSSSGDRDYTREVIEESGKILFHGVAIRPGKSLLCGILDGKPVIGLPGQPLASYTAWREVVSHLLADWGFPSVPDQEYTARCGEPVPGIGGIDEFVPVSVVRISREDVILSRPRGAAGQMQMVQSNGIIHIPAKREGFPEGESIRVRMIRRYRPGSEILIAGRSDLVSDRIKVMLPETGYQVILKTASPIGAATLLCKGTCHGIIIGESALDESSGISRILGAGCHDMISGIGAGFLAGERMIVVYRDTPEICEEIAPLIRLLKSAAWQNQESFPDGCTSDGAGQAVQIMIPGGTGRNNAESSERRLRA